MAVHFADLIVASDLPLPDLSRASGPADITMRRGPVPGAAAPLQQWPSPGGGDWLSIARADGGYRVSLPDLACLVAPDGRAITYDHADPFDPGMLAHLLLHQVLPLAVSRTGRFVLHACAVETPAGALAFIGQSGSGKSTLAAACCRRGFALVADDALVIDLEGGIGVWPTADGVRLWDDMRTAAPDGAAWRNQATGKLRTPVPLARARAPLARVCLLDTSHDGSSTVRPEPAAAARLEMLSHLFRLDVEDRDESRRCFEAANRVAAAVPARTVTYPNGLGYLDATVDAIVRDSIEGA